jgi:DNA modification methylase
MTKLENRCRVFQGDCLEVLPAIKAGSVNLVIADPPYNIDYEYDSYDDDLDPALYVAWCTDWMRACRRVLADDGAFWLVIGDEFVSELDVAAKSLGFFKRSHCVWYVTFGASCVNNFARSHVHLLYFVKDRKNFTFNKDETCLRVPSNRQLVYNDKRANPLGKLPDNTWVLSSIDLAKAFEPDEDTWLISRLCGTFKERADRGEYQKKRGVPQLPLKLVERMVLATSRPGDMVLDPVCGTGSSLEAALLHDRRATGIDLSERCVQISRSRLEKLTPRTETEPCPGKAKKKQSKKRPKSGLSSSSKKTTV